MQRSKEETQVHSQSHAETDSFIHRQRGAGSFARVTCAHSQTVTITPSTLSYMGPTMNYPLSEVSKVKQSCEEALREDILCPISHGEDNSTHICMKGRQR